MRKTWRGIRIAIVVICAAIFLACCGMLVRILIGYSYDKGIYESVNEGFETLGELSESPDETEGVVRIEGFSEEMQSQYDFLMNLKATYPDVVGYVSIPSVDINYPVVQTTNNSYYLNHLITGEESSSGTVFLDTRCTADAATAKNTVLYGHNMNNGTMFHNIEQLFEKADFFGATVEYITEDGIFVYRPFSVYRTDENDIFDKYRFADDEEYLSFCDGVAQRSYFEESLDIWPTADTGIITFVTCTNFVKTERYIYQAVLERVYLPESVTSEE